MTSMNKGFLKIIIIQKDDIKARSWADASLGFGLKVIPQKGSPILAPWFLIKAIFAVGVPQGYVLRYLNDYPSILKTLMRTSSEILLLILCKFLQIKVFWICHNVDRETNQHYGAISMLRRKIVSYFAVRIFVMDSLLVAKASAVIPKHQSKIDNISFGRLSSHSKSSGDERSVDFLIKARELADDKGQRFMSILCAGSPNNEKYLHFSYLTNLVQKAGEVGYFLAVVVAGRWDNSERSRFLLSNYKSNANILVFEEFTSFSSKFIKNNIDFYFRGYDDYSVPLTVYESCTMQKPILALSKGFLPNLVEHYCIGTVVQEDFSNLKDSLDYLYTGRFFKFDKFLERNNWFQFGEKIIPYL